MLFKPLPWGLRTILPLLLPLLQTVYKVIFRNRHQLYRRSLMNLLPSSSGVNFVNSQNLGGVKSDLWDGWETCVTRCFAKKSCIRYGERAGALFCWRCQSPCDHNCFRLLLIESLRLRRNFVQYSFVIAWSREAYSHFHGWQKSIDMILTLLPECRLLSTESQSPWRRQYRTLIWASLI